MVADFVFRNIDADLWRKSRTGAGCIWRWEMLLLSQMINRNCWARVSQVNEWVKWTSEMDGWVSCWVLEEINGVAIARREVQCRIKWGEKITALCTTSTRCGVQNSSNVKAINGATWNIEGIILGKRTGLANYNNISEHLSQLGEYARMNLDFLLTFLINSRAF